MGLQVGRGGGSGSGLLFGTGTSIFADNAARDAYFTANPTQLTQYDDNEFLLIQVGTGFQRRRSNAWIVVTNVVRGPQGVAGTAPTVSGIWTPTVSLIEQKDGADNPVAAGTVDIQSASWVGDDNYVKFTIFSRYTPNVGVIAGSFTFAVSTPFSVSDFYGASEIVEHIWTRDDPTTPDIDESRSYGGQGGGGNVYVAIENDVADTTPFSRILISIGLHTWATRDWPRNIVTKGVFYR